MKYIIMLMIVIGLALADFATGWIKAYCKGDVTVLYRHPVHGIQEIFRM